MRQQFRDREEAGRFLAEQLRDEADESTVVVALPRGGVPVAYPIAEALGTPLDVLLVRKLGTPGNEELAMGAVAEGDFTVVNDRVVDMLNIPDTAIEEVAARERKELLRRSRTYRGGEGPIPLHNRTVILVDDGLATGSTMRVALHAVKGQQPRKVIIAVPVAPPETCDDLRREADEVVCAITPTQLMSVGNWYQNFSQTTDEEVRRLLEQAKQFPVTQSKE